MRARPTILGLMGIIALVAVGMAAIRTNDVIWAAATLALTVLALCSATLVAIEHRGAWAGFAIFGWAMFLVCQPNSANLNGLSSQTTVGAYWLTVSAARAIDVTKTSFTDDELIHGVRALLCLSSLVVGLLGAIVGGFIGRCCVTGRDAPRGRLSAVDESV